MLLARIRVRRTTIKQRMVARNGERWLSDDRGERGVRGGARGGGSAGRAARAEKGREW